MKTFLALYTGFPPGSEPAPPSDEAIGRGMAAWGQWMADPAGD
ncbi:MAG: hypothetical protein JWQ29_1961, partial [Phenylobacterium sp.]|nr:hypothetical protein [Phenylobacterium sp.]